MAESKAPDIILAGFGTSHDLQITVETQQAAVRAGRVLALGLPARLEAMLKRQGVQVIDLTPRFDSAAYAESYAQIAETVLAQARKYPPAMFLSQGSPLLGNAITRYILIEAGKRELQVRTHPAVSPIDVIVADLGVDVGVSGLQTIGARGFLKKAAMINAGMPLLLLQLAGIAGASGSAEAYGPLVQALAGTYAEGHPVTLLNMPGDGRVTRATVTVARFAELIEHIDSTSSLFIDAVRHKP